MAVVRPTRYSVVSIGWFRSNQSVIDKVPGHSGDVFSVTGTAAFISATSFRGAINAYSTLSVRGAATFESTASFPVSVAVGGGAAVTVISTVTRAIDLPSMTGYAQSTLTFALSGLTRGDLVLYALDHNNSVTSNFRLLNIYVAASQTTAGEGTIGISNNTNLTVDQTSTVWRFTRIAQGAFV